MTVVRDPSDALEAEADLVARSCAGEPQAFARLYDLYADRIYRFLAFRMSDSAAAEDLTAEVFLRAWKSLPRYQRRGLPFGAWLFRIARNLLIDHSRSRRSEVSLEEVRLAGAGNPADEVARRLEAEVVRSALNELTDDQRQVLLLRFAGEMSTREIAATTGRQEGAVRALQFRALHSLAVRLKENVDGRRDA